MREEFASPIYFVRGNHEDFDYLYNLPVEGTPETAQVDPFDLYRFVPDGTVLELGDVRIAFLGGIETEVPDERTIDQQAYESLMKLDAGTIDVLVTHEPPYGIGVNWRGKIGSSRMVTELIKHTQPNFHLSSHVHHLNGPRTYGRTTSLSLDALVASPRWEPHDRNFRPGCLAILDTETAQLEPVMDQWLSRYRVTDFNPDIWFENFTSR